MENMLIKQPVIEQMLIYVRLTPQLCMQQQEPAKQCAIMRKIFIQGKGFFQFIKIRLLRLRKILNDVQ